MCGLRSAWRSRSLSPQPLRVRRAISARCLARFVVLAAALVAAAITAAATLAAYTESACGNGGWLSWHALSPSEELARLSADAAIPFPLDTDRRAFDTLVRLAGVNCSDLARGDAAAVERAEAFSRRHACAFANAAAAADASLAVMPCTELLARGYAVGQSPAAASATDNGFPLAFGLRLHRSAAQAELLLRSIYAPQNAYCIHVDAKATPAVRSAMHRIAACLPNVRIIEPSEWFVYGGVSPLAVDLRCMRLLLDADAASGTPPAARWRYFVNLAGQELPLRSVGELARLLRLYNGSNDIESADDASTRHRHDRQYWCGREDGSGISRDVVGGRRVRGSELMRPCWWSGQRRREPPPLPLGYASLYRGSSYGFFSRAFVEWTLEGFEAEAALPAGDVTAESPGRHLPPSAALYDWLSDTYAPDEHYWSSLNRLPGAPGGYAGPEETVTSSRAVVWRGDGRPCRGRYVRDVCVYGAGDVAWLLERSEPFANKFYYESDPIAVHCVVESVRARAVESERKTETEYLETYRDLPQLRAAAAALRGDWGARAPSPP